MWDGFSNPSGRVKNPSYMGIQSSHQTRGARMRRFAVATALLLLSPALYAQSAVPPLTARVEVQVVNVDVTVTDTDGKPVMNLTKDDFEIFEDGRPQKITNFYAFEGATPR